MSQCHYTDEKNAQIVIALLKAHGIKRVIANPGTTNIAIVGSIQNDPWFEVYSGIDERHSAYMAVGMAAATREPVVLSCTGATASRNYLPALTEAFYRKLPILAITSHFDENGIGQLAPQAIDRSIPPVDSVRKSFNCRAVLNDRDSKRAERIINSAILELTKNGGGPVHINLETLGCTTFSTECLPSVKRVFHHSVSKCSEMPTIINYNRIAIFVGSGNIDAASVEKFAITHGAAVFSDASSCYTGENRVHASLVCTQEHAPENPKYQHLCPDLLIDIGEVSGDYPTIAFLRKCTNVWRVSDDGELKSRFGLTEHVFEMPFSEFEKQLNPCQRSAKTGDCSYVNSWRDADSELRNKIGELPFSNPWIAKSIHEKIPNNSVVHFGILNSLRSWNLFPVNDTIRGMSNVGGFGIDGCVSTLIGSSIVNPTQLHFGIFGDLSFYYDLNAIGNRHIGRNLRILLVNNGCGAEFNIYSHPGSQFGDRTNDYIAAGGHFKISGKSTAQSISESLGFSYISAKTKEEFNRNVASFLSASAETPILFECFTNAKDESNTHLRINTLNPYTPHSISGTIASLLPQNVKNAIAELRK